MSRSEPQIKNPAEKFFSWSGSKGCVTYYDKEAKENVEVKLPFTFLALDRLVTITGYSKEDDSGFWANEIYNTKRDTLTVRTKRGIKKTGFYDEVKNLKGAKYTQSLYIAYHNEDKKLVIGNLKLSGCSVSEWIEFSKGKDIYEGGLRITEAVEDKNGSNTYFKPVFEQFNGISEKSNEAANALDQELKVYLKSYFAARGQEIEETPLTGQDYIDARNAEIEEFDEKAQAVGASNESLVGDNDFRTVDDSDIPFALIFALFGLGAMLAIYSPNFVA